ncbi:MAG: NAD(P)H-dependent oxidoreductase [Planctomycetes bacterium]|nr:NAD(P)H-dependent oxidoreductase [Planctomycetota bacterium]
MSTAPRVLAFGGSLRRASFNQQLVRVAAEGARQAGAAVTVLELRELPMPVFDEDLEREHGLPANAKRFKELLKEHDALLISGPEYNSSITAALKNAIDWASRAEPNEKPLACFAGKVCGLMAASPGALGGLRGLVTVRSILSNIQVFVLPDQLAVSKAHEAFTSDGKLKDEKQHAAVLRIGARVVEVARKLAQ